MYRNDLLQQGLARSSKKREQVAKETGLSGDTVNRALRGDPSIAIGRLLKIADSVEVSKRDLFDDSIVAEVAAA